jgi:hypothetical protein
MKKRLRGKNVPGGAEGAVRKASSKAHAAVDVIAGVAEDAARMAKPVLDRAAVIAGDAMDKAAGTTAVTADWVAEKARSIKTRRRRGTSA